MDPDRGHDPDQPAGDHPRIHDDLIQRKEKNAMTDNKYFKAFTRVFAITLALIMVLGAVMTQTVSAFSGKVGSKYTVHWYKELHYGPGEGGYSNAAKCDLGDDLGSRFSICVQGPCR